MSANIRVIGPCAVTSPVTVAGGWAAVEGGGGGGAAVEDGGGGGADELLACAGCANPRQSSRAIQAVSRSSSTFRFSRSTGFAYATRERLARRGR